VKALGLNARVPTRGKTVTVELTPKAAGTFEITCSEYCGTGHSRMKAWMIVTPGR
jgi:heme/copper-type cytochrome/quinol oxidase subunit 2